MTIKFYFLKINKILHERVLTTKLVYFFFLKREWLSQMIAVILSLSYYTKDILCATWGPN